MNLPHQEPIKFVEEIIEKKDDELLVSCSFPFMPTLAMVCEAAAQSSAGFAIKDKEKLGFLVTLKDVILLQEINFLRARIKLKRVFDFGTMSEYYFELQNNNESFVTGKLTIALQEG